MFRVMNYQPLTQLDDQQPHNIHSPPPIYQQHFDTYPHPHKKVTLPSHSNQAKQDSSRRRKTLIIITVLFGLLLISALNLFAGKFIGKELCNRLPKEVGKRINYCVTGKEKGQDLPIIDNHRKNIVPVDHYHHKHHHHHKGHKKHHHHHHSTPKLVIPIMDTITQLTDLDTMPLDLASTYYKSLRQPHLSHAHHSEPEYSILKSKNKNEKESVEELGKFETEMANEKQKVLKRLYSLLCDELYTEKREMTSHGSGNKEDTLMSVQQVIEWLGQPDVVKPVNDQDMRSYMMPGPFVSGKYNLEAPENNEPVEFYYYGKSPDQGLKLKFENGKSITSTQQNDLISWFGNEE